jgi:homoserine kinase type II
MLPLLAEYDLGTIKSIKLVKRGLENKNYRILTSEGGYFLRIYHGRTSEQHVRFEIAALKLLHRKGFPVAVVVSTKSKKDLIVIDGHVCVLFTMLGGRHDFRHTKQHMRQIGTIIAEIHLATMGKRFPHASARKRIAPATIRKRYATHIGSVRKRFPSIAARLDNIIKHVPEPNLRIPASLVHADLHDEATLFRNGMLVGIVDWDDAFYGPCLMDIGVVLECWCVKEGKIDYTLAREFIRAYERKRKFTKEEKASLYDYCLLVPMWFSTHLMQPGYLDSPEGRWSMRFVLRAVEAVIADKNLAKRLLR